MPQDISIIVVTYNSEKVIGTCLSLLPRDVRVLVLDNGSSDATIQRAQAFSAVEVIKNSNIGYGKAANKGLSLVTTPYALLLNPDVKLDPKALLIMLDALKKHPEVAVASASMFHIENGKKIYREEYAFDANGLAHTDWVVGALMLFNMDALKKVGMFDENIFLFFEETDLCSRLLEAGYKLAVCKGAEAEHDWGTSSSASLKTTKIRAWHSAWARAYYYKKHYGLARSLAKSLTKLLKNCIKIVKNLVSGHHDMSVVPGYEILGLVSFFLGIKAYKKDGTARIA